MFQRTNDAPFGRWPKHRTDLILGCSTVPRWLGVICKIQPFARGRLFRLPKLRSTFYSRAHTATFTAGEVSSARIPNQKIAMPRRTDIKKVLIIGSGPIIIGQACEFDYSGTQACKALREPGLPDRAGELQSRHHHDGSRHGGRDLHRAAHRAGAHRDHREGAAGRAAAQSRRPDRAESLLATGQGRRAGQIRRADHRRGGRCHREGRGPDHLQGNHEAAGHRHARAALRRSASKRRRRSRRNWATRW